MRGRDETDVCGHRFGTTDAIEPTLLENSQQGRLSSRRDVPNLVEKEGSSGGELETAKFFERKRQ